MLNLSGRWVAVVGGGPVAQRKVDALRQAGARVRWVCPHPPVSSEDGMEIRAENYHPEHLRGAWLVFACTDDRALNSRIAADARRMGAWVCAVDQPEDCDFFSPAVVRDGDVTAAVGTGGTAPALARRLAAQLQQALPEQIGAFAACLGTLRAELLKCSPPLPDDCRRAVLKDLAGEEAHRVFLAEGPAGLRKRMETIVGRIASGGSSCGCSVRE